MKTSDAKLAEPPVYDAIRQRKIFLGAAYVYLEGCDVKCGNCGLPHVEHHRPKLLSCDKCHRVEEPRACKNFRGWSESDGCDACRITLATRIDETRP